MEYPFKNHQIDLRIAVCDNSAKIAGGRIGGMTVLHAPIFTAVLKLIPTGEKLTLSSSDAWDSVTVTGQEDTKHFCFTRGGIRILITASLLPDQLIWTGEVLNDSAEYSVMSLTYPTPRVTAEQYHAFLPLHSGYLIQNAQHETDTFTDQYPGAQFAMQYFAAYNENGGIYLGIEDSAANVKQMTVTLKDGVENFDISFYGVGASLPRNSFSLGGRCVWQAFSGDWYDASMLYQQFVEKQARWLPKIGENGRTDVAKKYKDIPFWIADYIPNQPSQGENKPMNLSAGSDIYEPDYWHNAAIALQKELDVPIAYHVYNWHQIPFNIEYPHFLPAKETFLQHAPKLRANSIYVFPYINAVGWEIHDAQMGHAVNFENTGRHAAAIAENGDYNLEDYPQTTVKGETSQLSMTCGSSRVWHQMILDLTREMESTLPIDGIYYDQVAAVAARPCYNHAHDHLPGGGCYWADGYCEMMANIRKERPAECFYFSECNAEPYMSAFDGFLTWEWVNGNEVPAFSAVYAGYIQLLGRCTIGTKKDDFDFFKYCTAQSFVCGQQLGWCKADIVYSDRHLDFLKPIVRTRYRYRDLWNSACLLRPPVVQTDHPQYHTAPGLWFHTDIRSEYVISGAWRSKHEDKTVIFAINIANEAVNYELSFDAKEYGIQNKPLPEGSTLSGDRCRIKGTLKQNEIKVFEI